MNGEWLCPKCGHNNGSANRLCFKCDYVPVGDGIALTSMAHPPGLIDKIADAIRSGKLKA